MLPWQAMYTVGTLESYMVSQIKIKLDTKNATSSF